MKNFILLILTSLLTLLPVSFAQAKIYWGGFISASYIDVSANNYYGYNSGDSGPLYEAGLHGYWYIDPRWSLSGLLIARESGDWFETGLAIDYLSLNYQPQTSEDWALAFKLGRFKLANGIYGATRDVPFTRPSIILPFSVYPHVFKEQSLRADGLRMDIDYFSPSGQQYNFAASIGKEAFDESFSRRFFGRSQEGKFTADWNTSLHLSIQPNANWSVAFDYRRLKTQLIDAINLAIPIPPNGELVYAPFDFFIDLDQYILSLQYAQKKYELTAEYSLRRGGTYAKGKNAMAQGLASNFDGSIDMNTYYLQGIYMLTPQWSLFARYDNSHFVDADITPNLRDIDDLALGASWNFHQHFQLKIEHHWLTGTSMIPPVNDLNSNAVNNPERYWRLFAIQLSYRF
ncbi:MULTISPECIES: hypothetical protein [unclassified Agarivorans]|uniref:hypothetical protein n=1 Tax=unclassified Agarivorans TaxID=2636026 RepID=UPI003D7C861F